MKVNTLVPAIFLLLFSCSSPAEEKSATASVPADVPATAPAVSFPYAATYSSDWKMGNPETAKIVLDLYKALEDNKIDDFANYLADTVTTVSFDDVASTSSKEDVIARVKKFRSGFTNLTEEFLAFVPLHSNDKNEDWVATWMTERVTQKDGSKDSTTYQETWRFRNGKIYYRGAFARYKPE